MGSSTSVGSGSLIEVSVVSPPVSESSLSRMLYGGGTEPRGARVKSLSPVSGLLDASLFCRSLQEKHVPMSKSS